MEALFVQKLGSTSRVIATIEGYFNRISLKNVVRYIVDITIMTMMKIMRTMMKIMMMVMMRTMVMMTTMMTLMMTT